MGLRVADRHPIGAGGLRPTRLGFGGGIIGNFRRRMAEAEAAEVIAAAYAAGIRHFDTAPLYGHGRSEQRLGRQLARYPRDSFVLSTKVGRLLRPASGAFETHQFEDVPPLEVRYDYSRDGTLRSIEESLERLGLDRIDIALIHDIDRTTHGDRQPEMFAAAMAGAYPALAELRAQGVVKAIGLGVNEWQPCVAAAERGAFDCFLLAGRYTLLEQEPLDRMLPLCQERGIAVIAGAPFNSGVLAAAPGQTALYNYAPAPPAILERARRLDGVCARHGVPLAAAALQFPAFHPAVATVLTGFGSVAELTRNTALFEQEIPPALWAELKAEGLLAPDAPTP